MLGSGLLLDQDNPHASSTLLPLSKGIRPSVLVELDWILNAPGQNRGFVVPFEHFEEGRRSQTEFRVSSDVCNPPMVVKLTEKTGDILSVPRGGQFRPDMSSLLFPTV